MPLSQYTSQVTIIRKRIGMATLEPSVEEVLGLAKRLPPSTKVAIDRGDRARSCGAVSRGRRENTILTVSLWLMERPQRRSERRGY